MSVQPRCLACSFAVAELKLTTRERMRARHCCRFSDYRQLQELRTAMPLFTSLDYSGVGPASPGAAVQGGVFAQQDGGETGLDAMAVISVAENVPRARVLTGAHALLTQVTLGLTASSSTARRRRTPSRSATRTMATARPSPSTPASGKGARWDCSAAARALQLVLLPDARSPFRHLSVSDMLHCPQWRSRVPLGRCKLSITYIQTLWRPAMLFIRATEFSWRRRLLRDRDIRDKMKVLAMQRSQAIGIVISCGCIPAE